MTYQELKLFLEKKMVMSHIYQPLLIKLLVDSGGVATVRHLALQFLGYDESQVMYYEKTLKNMPIKVLSRHGVIKRNEQLVMLEVQKLSLEQKAEIKKICEQKIQDFIVNRGLSIWDYRLLDANVVPDSLRFRVLKEARGRCAMCGVTRDDRPIDIDHIIPLSKGGKTVYSNLQVLCSKCNRSKGNKDQTDFRSLPKVNESTCLFCSLLDSKKVIDENEFAFSIMDKYPVTTGYVLIIPIRHIASYSEITSAEMLAIHDLIKIRTRLLSEENQGVSDYNIGVNNGENAGQTIHHLHFHLIPRRKGDVVNPRGGIRSVVPEKKEYFEV
jgi:ATP adenylyltransferase